MKAKASWTSAVPRPSSRRPAEWAKIYESDTRLVTDILNAQHELAVSGPRPGPFPAVHKEPYGARAMRD